MREKEEEGLEEWREDAEGSECGEEGRRGGGAREREGGETVNRM